MLSTANARVLAVVIFWTEHLMHRCSSRFDVAVTGRLPWLCTSTWFTSPLLQVGLALQTLAQSFWPSGIKVLAETLLGHDSARAVLHNILVILLSSNQSPESIIKLARCTAFHAINTCCQLKRESGGCDVFFEVIHSASLFVGVLAVPRFAGQSIDLKSRPRSVPLRNETNGLSGGSVQRCHGQGQGATTREADKGCKR